MALPQAKLDATESRLGAVTMPEGATWITQAREAAMARVREMGLPTARDEYWKFTKPDTLVQADAPDAALFDDGEGPIFEGVDSLKVVFVDGVFDAEASDDLSLEGLKIERLADVARPIFT